MKQMAMRRTQGGALMIEVLITIVIVIIGSMGLMQMQGRLQKSEMESYQRTQAMILLSDIASRMSSNRPAAASYITPPDTYLGAGSNCAGIGTTTVQLSDAREWCFALQGAAETQAGSNVGAMLGGRGCVEAVDTDQYMVTVVWQGMTPISAPPAPAAGVIGVKCGANLYNLGSPDCVGDMCRRYVTTLVSLANLDT
jgi:type IV pilus assembly protein PilV